MNSKLSVIIPVYNTLPYLQNCFDSIKRQAYEQLEVILIDDGSTDGSSEFCDTYVRSDSRFRVIHKSNGGLSSARNTGIDAATGRYITFVDSDDALVGQPYSTLIGLMKEQNAQIVCMEKYCSAEPAHDVSAPNKVMKSHKLGNVEFYEKLCKQTISEAAWDKIYDCSLFRTHRFQDGVLNEDFLLMIQLCSEQITVIQTDYLGYYYLQRKGSITGSGFKKNMIDALYNADYAYSNAPTEACKKAAEGYLLHRILMFLVNMPVDFIKNRNMDYLFAMKRLKEINISKSNRSKRDKLVLRCFLLFPTFSRRLCGWYL